MDATSEQFSAEMGEPEDQLPALRQLGLDRSELETLSRQGYLTCEAHLPEGNGYWRLRFRFQGRLRSIYLGADLARVEEVRRDLESLRAARRRQRILADVVRDGKLTLRKAKQRLTPTIAQLGYHYHGDSLRKSRRTERPSNESKEEKTMEDSRLHDEDVATAPSAPEPQLPEAVDDARDGIFRQRLEVIQARGVEGLRHPNKLVAALSGVNSDLMEIELYLGAALLKELTNSGISLGAIRNNAPAMDLALRYSRQIAQISQLEKQEERSDRPQTRKRRKAKKS